MRTYVKKIAYPIFMLSLLVMSYVIPLLPVITAHADTEGNTKIILFQNEKGTAQVTSLPDPTTGKITWTIEVEKNQQSAANQLAFSLSKGEQTVLSESIQSNGTPFTYDPQRQQLMEETTSSSFSQMTLTFQTKALKTLTIKSAFLQTEEKNGQVKEDIINTTDVAVVLPDNQSTEATSAEAVLADSQEQTEASEKQPATKSSESQPQAESTTVSTTIESPLDTQASAPAASQLSSGGSFNNDVPEVDNVLLGEAQYFHIFANHATLNTHTNGNIAVGELNGAEPKRGTIMTTNLILVRQALRFNYCKTVKCSKQKRLPRIKRGNGIMNLPIYQQPTNLVRPMTTQFKKHPLKDTPPK